MLNLAEYRQRPALLADWLPWAGLVAPGVVLNKDGSFQRTARFRGPDLDSATQGELIATTARLNNALRRLGAGWALFVEAERRPAADYPHSDFPEPLSWLVDEERRATFEGETEDETLRGAFRDRTATTSRAATTSRCNTCRRRNPAPVRPNCSTRTRRPPAWIGANA